MALIWEGFGRLKGENIGHPYTSRRASVIYGCPVFALRPCVRAGKEGQPAGSGSRRTQGTIKRHHDPLPPVMNQSVPRNKRRSQ